MHVEVSVTAKASLEKTYAAYTDFEAMPKWLKQLVAVRVTKLEGDKVHLESEGVSGGRRRRTAELRLLPPDRVEAESETRYTRSKQTVTFEVVPEGTKVGAMLEIQVKGLWAKILTTRGKDEIESSALEELTSFARYVETLP